MRVLAPSQVEAIQRSFATQSAVSDQVLVEGTGHVGVGSIVEIEKRNATTGYLTATSYLTSGLEPTGSHPGRK